jgi:uncharacterized membrane protein
MINGLYGNAELVMAFLGALAQSGEVCTDVQAVSVTRGPCVAIAGVCVSVLVFAFVASLVIPALFVLAPFEQNLVLGILILLLGMRWLRKAILRYGGTVLPRNETEVFNKSLKSLKRSTRSNRYWFDWLGFLTAFKAAFVGGWQVVCIVIVYGCAGQVLGDAATTACVAMFLVLGIGLLYGEPLTGLPYNRFQFAVGALMSAFGTFWTAEGLGFKWPDSPLTILVLALTFWATGWIAVLRARTDHKYTTIIPFRPTIP